MSVKERVEVAKHYRPLDERLAYFRVAAALATMNGDRGLANLFNMEVRCYEPK